MSQTHTPLSRLSHIDAAKGVSIFLVVYWHAVDDRLVFNEALWMLRMPLFFFVSGLFAAKALEVNWHTFLINKVGNILYLYVFWTFVVFATTILVAQVLGPDPINWRQPFMLFIEPPRTLWFMYALAVSFLIAKLIKPLPAPAVFAALFALYCWSISGGDWRTVPFYEKVIRLFPFFYLAMWVKQPFLDLVERHHRFGWPLLGLFAVSALVLFLSPVANWGILTFAVGLLGVFGVAMSFRAIPDSRITSLVANIGNRSLLVYVMHRIPLFYMENAMEVLGLPINGMTMSIVALIATWLCLVIGERILLPLVFWMFDAPWLAPKARLNQRLTNHGVQ